VLPLTLTDILRATRQPPSSKSRPNSDAPLGTTPVPLAAPLLRHLLRGLLQGVADIHAAGYALRTLDTNCVYLTASGNVRIGGFGGAVRVPVTPIAVTASDSRTTSTTAAAAAAADAATTVVTGRSSNSSVDQTSTVFTGVSSPSTPNSSSGNGSSTATVTVVKEPHKRALPLLAPELLLGSREYTHASDMWAVGCIAVQLAVGKPLFTGTNRKQQCGHVFKACGTPGKDNWLNGALLPLYSEVKLVDTAGNPLNCK
jgi:serine/threonine protein kinase